MQTAMYLRAVLTVLKRTNFTPTFKVRNHLSREPKGTILRTLKNTSEGKMFEDYSFTRGSQKAHFIAN